MELEILGIIYKTIRRLREVERKDRPTRTLGPKEQHGGEFLEFLFTSYIPDWITEKPATQTLQRAQSNKKSPRENLLPTTEKPEEKTTYQD